jgi:hypothetical protein
VEPFAKILERVAIGDDRKGWLFRTGQGLERNHAGRSTDESSRRLANGAPARSSRRHQGSYWRPYFPRDRDHGVFGKWRDARACSGHGRARESRFGETNQEIRALIAAASEIGGGGFLLPTRNSELFRWCLENGLRLVHQMR